MKSNSKTSFIIVFGAIVVIVFTTVLSINLLPNYESNSYFGKVNPEMIAKIDSVIIEDNKLVIKTSGNPDEYCVKTTRTEPSSNSLCWNEIKENTTSISILKNKKYYVWIKDDAGNISNYVTVNSSNNKN